MGHRGQRRLRALFRRVRLQVIAEFLSLEPRAIEPEAFVAGEFRLAHHPREAGEHLVVGARDRHPAAVRAWVVAVRGRGVGLGAAALAPTSSPLLQQRFMEKTTAPAPAGSRITPSSQEIRLRNTPTNSRGDPTRECERQHWALPSSPSMKARSSAWRRALSCVVSNPLGALRSRMAPSPARSP